MCVLVGADVCACEGVLVSLGLAKLLQQTHGTMAATPGHRVGVRDCSSLAVH